MLLHVADDYGFHIQTLQHVLEGYKVAKEIAAHGTGASTFSDWWAYKVEAYDAIPYNAALMMRKGVLVSLNSDDPELMRHLNTEAAKTMKYGGLTETEALSTITINPAKQLRIDNRVGSLEVGKDADMVLYDGHPLSNFAKVTKVLIDGQVYFDRDKDLEARPEKAEQKQLLITKAADEKKKAASQSGSRRPGQ
jgi:imidazolonepropionase-like amidohydrolase